MSVILGTGYGLSMLAIPLSPIAESDAMPAFELFGDELDRWVARAEGRDANGFTPSADWAQGGPIIEREHISIVPSVRFGYSGAPYVSRLYRPRDGVEVTADGPTPLIAAMRCYVAFKFGGDLYERP